MGDLSRNYNGQLNSQDAQETGTKVIRTGVWGKDVKFWNATYRPKFWNVLYQTKPNIGKKITKTAI